VTDLTALFTDLVRLETRLYNVLNARLKAEHALPLGQFEFLRFIAAHGTARVYDLVNTGLVNVLVLSAKESSSMPMERRMLRYMFDIRVPS